MVHDFELWYYTAQRHTSSEIIVAWREKKSYSTESVIFNTPYKDAGAVIQYKKGTTNTIDTYHRASTPQSVPNGTAEEDPSPQRTRFRTKKTEKTILKRV